MIRFLSRHPAIHRIVHRLTARGEPYENADGSTQFPTCIVDRLVWRELERDVSLMASIRQGELDIAEGRSTLYRVRDGQLVNAETGEPFA